MLQKMLKFVDRDRVSPDQRSPEARRTDFDEIYTEFAAEKAAEQASRCSQCGVPFCQVHCPLGNNIPDWLRATAEGRLEEAYALAAETNAMPEICGRICPQDRLCEDSCVLEQSGHGTITIGAIERYVTETAWDRGWVKPIRAGAPTGRSVGIIGAGPVGLTAAEGLRRQGHDVAIYDRHDRAGGLLTYGIPNFKLEKHAVARRVERLLAAGVSIHLETEIGKSVSFSELRDRHDAILIATGVYSARELSVPGIQSAGVIPALDYLVASNRRGFGDTVPDFDSGRLNAKEKRVVVVGGGDTAMDCVRTAARQGAASVTCLYRRDRANMPGSQIEVSNADAEGVAFEWLASPQEIIGNERVTGVRAERMQLGAREPDGRQRMVRIENSAFSIEADMVITALGFDPENLPKLFHEPGLGLSRWGTIVADPITGATSIPGVFAGGDIVRGASLVVWAVRDGRELARSIGNCLAHMQVSDKAQVL